MKAPECGIGFVRFLVSRHGGIRVHLCSSAVKISCQLVKFVSVFQGCPLPTAEYKQIQHEANGAKPLKIDQKNGWSDHNNS